MSGCPSCGQEVALDQRFCIACGASLASLVCPTCGTAPPPGARYCGQCGAGLAGLASALEEAGPGQPRPSEPRPTERRLVSVLFADLVGFTALSEGEDPESVREFLTAYFDRASEVIDRYGGTVEKFIGDAVMAVWGTPTAHEDDAERAVRAALDLVAMLGSIDETAQLRAAVMTGEAAVSPSAQGHGLVAGDLVNSSSRLQSASQPGTVLVDETTMVAAGRAIAFDAVGEISLKGKAEPLRAWAALHLIAERGGIGRRDLLEPPFVGRHEELRLLKELLHATSREGKARLVTVVGQAGFGKSRLAWELKKYADGLTETIYWHEGQSPAYGEGVAYWALGGMVSWRCRIGDDDTVDVARAKLAETTAGFMADAEELDWMEPRLAALLGIAEAPAGDREELFAAWRIFFERIAEHGTVTLIFEDLHWADDSLFDFIDHLLEWSRDHPILVVALTRPELLDRRPRWGTEHRATTTVHVEPLPDDAMGDLMRGLVPGLPEAVLSQIVMRAEGVPLYAVETIRMLLDEGRLVHEGERYRLIDASTEVAVPASLQALVTARLDALEPDERSLVQDAAILGKSFSRPALAAVSGRTESELDEPLGRLARKEIVAPERSRVSADHTQYEFVQSLLREVAYSTLSRRGRRDRHMAAAGHYESLADEELAGLLANHFLDAYRAVPDGQEGDEAAAHARVSLRAAAERSVSLHANSAAVNFIEQALSVTHDPEERAELWVMAADPAWAAMDPEVGEHYIRQAIDWYTDHDRQEQADSAIATMAGFLVHTSKTDEVGDLVEQRVALIDDSHAGPSAPRLLNELARVRLMAGRVDEAIAAIDRGLLIAEYQMAEPAIAELLATKSWALGLRGRHRESIVLSEGGLRLAQEHGLVNAQLRVRFNLSDLLTGIDPRRGFEVARGGVEIAERFGQASWAAALSGNEGFAALLLGEWEAPIARAEELDRPHLSRMPRTLLGGTAAVARAFLGRPGPTLAELEIGSGATDEEIAQERTMLLAYRAFEAWASGDLDAVDRLALDAAEGTSHHSESAVAACFAVHAMAWLRERDRLAATLQHLVDLPWSTDLKATTIRQGKAALAALDGSYGEAANDYRATIEVWRRLGMLPDVAVAHMEMLLLLGDNVVDRDGSQREPRSILEALGAVPLLRRLDELSRAQERTEVVT